MLTGLCPNRLRELRRRCRGRRQARRAGPVGYGRPGRLRQTAPALIPRLARHPHLLRHRLA